MTILSVAAGVARKCGLAVLDTLMSNTSRDAVEILEVIQESAEEIAEAYDWQLLSTIATVTGDGTDTAFDLPSDYDRMIVDTGLWLPSLQAPLTPVESLDKWLELDVLAFDFIVHAWIIYNNQIHVRPALASGEIAKYFYQSNLIVSPNTGMNKTTFTDDADTFRLDERLLKLCAIWRWKSAKGQPYAEEMEDYEELKSKLILRDRGSRMVKIGRPRTPGDIGIAYPKALG